MRFDRHILSIVLLIATLAYTLWFVFAGFGNHLDPLYWLYKYEHLEGGWMAVGTLLTGGAIVRLFGLELLPLRIAGWLCVTAAIAMPYCTLLDRDTRRTNLHWLALTYLLMGYGAFQEFSPGTLTVLLLSAIWVTVFKSSIFHQQSSIFTALLAGLAITVRFPNILVLLILIPLWKKRSLWLVPIAAFTAGVVYLLGYLIITPAPLDAAMTSHELTSMITKLWENLGKLLGFMLMSIGVLAFPLREKRYAGWFVGAALALFIIYTLKPYQWYNADLTYLISAFCIVLAFCTPYTVHHTPYTPEGRLGFAILMVATLGTDTAWLKLFPAVLCLLPVALSQYREFSYRRYLLQIIIVLSGVVIARMTTNSIAQSNLTKATIFASVSPYRGIAIRPAEQSRLLQYKADYDSLTNDQMVNDQMVNILALGQELHLMRAVTGCEAARYNEFWSNIFDSVYTAKYEPIIEAERPVVFCSFSPMFKTKPSYTDRESRMEQMLRSHGYHEIDRSKYKYMIYIPQSNE